MTITNKMIKEWVHLYTTTDMSTYDIADKYHCSSTTVSNYLKINGIKLHRKGRHMSKYYRRKYIIVIYDLNDNLYRMFNNAYEMSKVLNRPYNSVHRALLPDNINKKIRINGQWYKKELISAEENKC